MSSPTPHHEPTFAEVGAADDAFACTVTCSCGDFERTSTSAKGASQARANARASFNRHVRKVEAEQPDVSATSTSADTASGSTTTSPAPPAEDAPDTTDPGKAPEPVGDADTADSPPDEVEVEPEEPRPAEFPHDAAAVDDVESVGSGRSESDGDEAAASDEGEGTGEGEAAASDEAEGSGEGDAPGDESAEEATVDATTSTPAVALPPLGEAVLATTPRTGVVDVVVGLATVLGLVLLVLAAVSGTDSTPSTRPEADPTPVGSLPTLPLPMVTAPPRAAYLDILRQVDPVFSDFDADVLVQAGWLICRDYGRGASVVDIAASIAANGEIDPVQSFVMIDAAGRELCPQYRIGISTEVSGLS
ncbi:DUF732 domain-containing protein [Nocardioides sp. R-C-SC26]|uniref:DUF732 domain-containing protein n=1 Tax=Nocardioides sp. R-C-SC26 TaxID=2870414 RepID=UPI001E6127C7|nr:DUF732 domain-containing protein [Nocardioides sp. R-C-SC26]